VAYKILLAFSDSLLKRLGTQELRPKTYITCLDWQVNYSISIEIGKQRITAAQHRSQQFISQTQS
jgi:hypothetical protein